MESHILESLPAIHGILVSVGTAFFSGFAMFAYEKLREARDKLSKVLTEVEQFSTPSNFIGSGSTRLVSDAGELDWDGAARDAIRKATSIYSHLDYEEKYGTSLPASLARQNPAQESLEACRELCLMFHYLFTSYPFSGRSMVHIKGVSEKLEQRKGSPFNKERLGEIERRISFLAWTWETQHKALLHLANESSKYENEQNLIESQKAFQESLKLMPEIDDQEKERIWNTFHAPRAERTIDYAQILTEYFEKVIVYRNNVLPSLREAMSMDESFNERFKFKKLSVICLKVLAFVFTLGIAFPLLITNLQQDINLVWHPTLPYLLLFVTSLPYLSIWLAIFRRVQRLEYE
jgi:hypothetical protein